MRIAFEKGAQVMKTRGECLEKYGSDYFIEKKIEEGELESCAGSGRTEADGAGSLPENI